MKSTPPVIKPTMEQVTRDLRLDRQEIRARAMLTLLSWTRTNPAIHEAALPLFRQALGEERDPWTAINAAHGIELIVGSDACRGIWLTLLNHPSADVVSRTAMGMSDTSFAPILLHLLKVRNEASIRLAVIRTLGRMKYSPALPAIANELQTAAMRPDAVEALRELGDAEAIAYLEPMLQDKTDAWREDDRGAMLRVCDLANAAILRLRAGKKQSGVQQASLVADQPAERGTPLHVAATDSPGSRTRLLAYAPLAAALLEIPWVAAVLFVELFRTGKLSGSPAAIQRTDLIGMVPAAAGLSVGVFVIVTKRVRGVAQHICLYVGCAACGLVLFSFGWELLG